VKKKDPFVVLGGKKKRDLVIEQVQNAIHDEVYHAGDKLPSEAELGRRLGVSRTTIREAMSALELLGTVEIVHGEGTYIRKAEDSPKEEVEALDTLVESGSFLEAIRVRRALDELTVSLAIERASDEEVARLGALLKAMEQAVANQDYEGYLDNNMNFHLTLVQAAQDPILIRLTRYLVRVMELLQVERLDYYVKNEDRAQETLAIHQRFFASFQRKDLEASRRNMREHYDVVIRRLEHAQA